MMLNFCCERVPKGVLPSWKVHFNQFSIGVGIISRCKLHVTFLGGVDYVADISLN